MPIIEEISYDGKIRNDVIVQFYRTEPTQRRKKIGGTIRKMFRSDNSMIRPRKIHGSWAQQPKSNVSTVFAQDLALALPLEPYSAPKYARKPTLGGPKTITKILQEVGNYCEKSTLHGLRYVGDSSLSLFERIFWFTAFASAFAFASYYISNIFEKWNDNPVLVAFNPTDATFNEIPFPAITICNMNQAKKVEAERIIREGSSVERRLLNDYCNYNNTFEPDEGPVWDVVQNFLIKVGQSCSDIMKSCMWQNDKISCEEYFNNDLTDEGLCCSFNRLPPENIFRNPNDFTYLNHTYPKRIYDWSPEKGFQKDSDGDLESIPIRPSGAGTHLGLTVVVDAQMDNFFCSSTSSTGFKIVLSNPIETPTIADFGFLVSPGVEARYIIQPEIRQSTKSLRDVSVLKRQCYFQDERPLRYFRSYTKRNCGLECQSNHTLNKCGCIPFYLPKGKKVKVCGKRDEKCTFDAKEDMELVYGNGSSCQCLASCFEMNFDKAATYSNLISMHKKHELENISDEYFQKNMAVLHFFFKDSKFHKQIKSEIYGFTEVLSNVGGLLGLCLGFSFLSLVEIVYYLTLKLLCGYVHSRTKGHKKKKENNGQYSNSVIPFMK